MINVIYNVMNVFNDRGGHLHTAAQGRGDIRQKINHLPLLSIITFL